MIQKIISGGQTGADQGALDAAIKLGLAHGGWIPKGRKTETGPLPISYKLKETSSSHYSKRTKLNVEDSDGTLIVSHGKLSGGSAYCRTVAQKHGKPLMHIDLNRTAAFPAALTAKKWVLTHAIRFLNVAGPRASKDPSIYQTVFNLVETLYYLLQIDTQPSPENVSRKMSAIAKENWPNEVKNAVTILTQKIPLKDRIFIANMFESELAGLDQTLGRYIRDHFGLWGENRALIHDCKEYTGQKDADIHPDTAVAAIIKELWFRLKKTHRLRIIK